MEKNYNKELDFVLEELIIEYKKQFKDLHGSFTSC